MNSLEQMVNDFRQIVKKDYEQKIITFIKENFPHVEIKNVKVNYDFDGGSFDIGGLTKKQRGYIKYLLSKKKDL